MVAQSPQEVMVTVVAFAVAMEAENSETKMAEE